MNVLMEKARGIQSHEEMASFIRALRLDLVRNPHDWENGSLDVFLEALAAWIEDIDGYYLNKHEVIPNMVPWRIFADALLAAKIYE